MTDESQFNIEIKFPFNVATSGIIPLVPKAWQEMLEDGTISSVTIPITLAQRVITAHIGQDLAGFLSYTRHVAHGFVWLDMSYVRPEYRRIGVYSKLFDALVCSEKEHPQPVQIISSGISKNNYAQIAAAKKSGRTSSYLIYDYKIAND